MTTEKDDRWLDRWLPLIRERAAGGAVLELGCGPGTDTRTLLDAGLDVVALDLSAASIALAKLRAWKARFHCQDIREPWPLEAPASLGAIVASLSLHYFEWDETLRLVARVRQALRRGGVFACRLNSTNDTNWGATGHAQIAPNYYLVDGHPKRFFDRASLDALFASGWRVLSIEERVIHRYELPKSVWEVVLEAGD